jgi:hypothetical protein
MEGGYGSQPSLATIEDLTHIFKVTSATCLSSRAKGCGTTSGEELRRSVTSMLPS